VERWQDNGGLVRGFWLEERWISVGKSGDFHAISRDVPARFSNLKLRLGEMSVSFKGFTFVSLHHAFCAVT
jgi:hypothetical protein